MKEIILIDPDYNRGGHNKIYADSVYYGIKSLSSTPVRIYEPVDKVNKINFALYLIRAFSERDKHLHFLYIDPLLKYASVLYHLLSRLKKFNNLTVTCTYHVFNKNRWLNSAGALFDGIVVHSDWQLPELPEIEGAAAAKMQVINYPSFLKPGICRRSTPEEYRIGFLGANRPEKRLDLFIEAMNRCPHNVEAVIGGADTAPVSNNLILNKKAKIISRHLSEDELRGLIEYIDILVLPYDKTFRGQSGPLIEAAFAGKVIVSSDAPVLKETVLGCNLGEVFESGSIEDLLGKLERVIRDYHTYNCNHDFQQNHSTERFLEFYYEFFMSY